MPKAESFVSDSDRTPDISKVFARNQGCSVLQINLENDPEQNQMTLEDER